MRVLSLISDQLATLTLGAALLAYWFPEFFLPFQETFLWFFALTMLALGLAIEPDQFRAVIRQPAALVAGIATQYSLMPLLGFLTAWMAGLGDELALGFILVGCAPGAMASGVIVFLAGGAAAYSVALTTISTMLSPVLTPLLVEFLGGVFLPIPFWPMTETIVWTVVIPLAAGILLRRFLGRRSFIWAVLAPPIAVFAILVIVGYAVAANVDRITQSGLKIFILVVGVNLLGYVGGWFLGAVYGMEASYRLALAIEIGMQNAGLGVALALRHFNPNTAIPGVLFAVWCILTASVATQLIRKRKMRASCDGRRH